MMLDPKAEALLAELGYRFKLELIQIVDIDVKGAEANPARYGKRIDYDRVSNMAVAAKNGELPAIVVCRSDTPGLYKYNVGEGSGLHRLLAYKKAAKTECWAYVVSEPDPKRRHQLPILLNSREGVTNSATDRYRAIFDTITRGSGDARSLCIYHSVRYASYLAWERIEKTKTQMRRMGIAVDRLTQEQVKELSKVPNDNVLKAIVNMLMTYKPSLAILEQLIAQIESSPIKTEEAWLLLVERQIGQLPRPSVGDPNARRKPASEKWCDYIAAALNLFAKEKLDVLGGPDDSKRSRACIEDALDMLKLLKHEDIPAHEF